MPSGIPKSNIAAEVVPELATVAGLPGASVVVEPAFTVAALPTGPCLPTNTTSHWEVIGFHAFKTEPGIYTTLGFDDAAATCAPVTAMIVPTSSAAVPVVLSTGTPRFTEAAVGTFIVPVNSELYP